MGNKFKSNNNQSKERETTFAADKTNNKCDARHTNAIDYHLATYKVIKTSPKNQF